MTKAAEWRERIRAWRESGKTADEFADGQGYRGNSLRWWSSELARRDREQAETAPAVAQPAKKTALRLVRVQRQIAPTCVECIVIRVGSAELAVAPGFDPKLLAAVVRALGEAR